MLQFLSLCLKVISGSTVSVVWAHMQTNVSRRNMANRGYAWPRNRHERTRSSLAAVQNLPVNQWGLFFLCPGLVASAGTVTDFKCVYHGRQYDAVYSVYLFHICCDSDLTTQHIRDIQSITLYMWWYTCIRPVNKLAYQTWQFWGRFNLQVPRNWIPKPGSLP